jgi:hypothetical protein
LSHRYCTLPLAAGSSTVVRVPDDEWWYHTKPVEQFPDKINCITLHLVGYVLEYSISFFLSFFFVALIMCEAVAGIYFKMGHDRFLARLKENPFTFTVP